MHRDKKVGLALGILLCSIVGAFFFRDDAPRGSTPELKGAQQLDSEIARGNRKPYSDQDANRRSRSSASSIGNDEPEFLRDLASSGNASRNRLNTSRDPFDSQDWNHGSAEPSRSRNDDASGQPVPIPDHNKDWDVADELNPIARREPDVRSAIVTKGRTHVVADGETLSSIAGKYLGSQARYLDVYNANKDQLRSPNDLKVGMKLSIPDSIAGKSGSTRAVVVERTPSTKTTKPTLGTNSSRTTNRVDSATSSDNVEPTKKPKFKPAKSGPAIRRSAEAEDATRGRAFSQLSPIDLEEVDDELIAELEQQTGVTSLAASPNGSASLPRIANATANPAGGLRPETKSDDAIPAPSVGETASSN